MLLGYTFIAWGTKTCTGVQKNAEGYKIYRRGTFSKLLLRIVSIITTIPRKKTWLKVMSFFLSPGDSKNEMRLSYGQMPVDYSSSIDYNESEPAVNFRSYLNFRRLLFDEKQHLGDCGLTGRFAPIQSPPNLPALQSTIIRRINQ